MNRFMFGITLVLIGTLAVAHEGHHSRFAGKYAGTWGNHVQHGTIEFTVADDGSLVGSLTNDGAVATFDGAIGEADKFTGDFQFDYRFGDMHFSGAGPILHDEKGHLIAVLRLYKADKQPLGAIALDMAPVKAE